VTPQNIELSSDVVSGAVTYPHGMELAFLPVDALKAHPLNANSTDTAPIVESIHMNGFIDPVLVQTSTSYILDGWHRYAAVVELGGEFIPALLIDCDDATAHRLLVACNRTARLGRDDPGQLRTLMDMIRADDERLLGTGWTPPQYEYFLTQIEAPYEPNVEDLGDYGARQNSHAITCPACGNEFGGAR
jgi:ParB-like nuclease domain